MNSQWILGINCSHNASICLLKDGKIVLFLEEDRLSKQKHDNWPMFCIEKIKEYTEVVDYVIASVGPAQFLGDLTFPEVIFNKFLKTKNKIVTNSSEHHLYHAASAFYSSGFEDAICVVADGTGAGVNVDGHHGNEIESIYYFDYSGLDPQIICKKYMSGWEQLPILDVLGRHNFYPCGGVGMMYAAVSEALGWNHFECGKVMGLSSYGKPDNKIPDIYVNLNGHKLPNRNLFFNDKMQYGRFTSELVIVLNPEQYNRENLSYAIQKSTQEYMTEVISDVLKKTGSKNLVISGGYGLNCVANYEYLKHIPSDVKVFVDPTSNDSGQSIGAAQYLYHQINGFDKVSEKQKTYYLGPEPEYKFVLKDNESVVDVSYSDIVELILQKNIIALYQGKSEAGPRALGNRSLIFDPRVIDGKDIVNQVKKREWFRPFAGTVLKEHVHDWFDMRTLKESPFMTFAVDVLKDKVEQIPAVTHVDNTCRVQTVTEEQNKHFYNLIKNFYEKTKVPILLNTSFNLAGDPLVETVEDALDTIRRSELKYLYLPDLGKLIIKD